MDPLVFIGEVKLATISEDSAVRVMIEISLPPPKEEQRELNEARKVLIETYGGIAGMVANYLGAVQYELIANPYRGVESATIIYEHIKKAVEEVAISVPEIARKNGELKEKEFLKSYQ
ncbi:MAG: hypothetical protein NTZ84_02025 [Candidatus Nealsonbacteria bacterium]|nr:hypothetical protein [Candidatus Nealsonbacteria bacterium]